MFTIRAKPVKRNPGGEDRVARCPLEFPDCRRLEIRLPVNDLVALDTDQMRMGLRAVAVVVTVVAQVDLQHLVHVLEQRQGLVYRGMAHGRELALDPCVELGRAGMPITGRDQPHQLDPLGGQPEVTFLQRSDQFIKADFSGSHSGFYGSFFLIDNLYPLVYPMCSAITRFIKRVRLTLKSELCLDKRSIVWTA
jgi:hypothetical protein